MVVITGSFLIVIMWKCHLCFLFFVVCAQVSFCLSSSNEKSGGKGDAGEEPTLSSFQQYTNAIPRDHPISKHGRRDVETSVKAYSWPSTIFSPLCEAWAYFDAGESSTRNARSKQSSNNTDDNNSFSWKYLDALVELGGIESLDNWIDEQSKEIQPKWNYDNSTTMALDIASQITQSSHTLDRQLLPMALSLRAHAPHCEMHRSLARDAAIAYGLYDVEKAKLPPSAFCLLSRRGGDNILGTEVLMDESLLTAALNKLMLLENGVESNIDDEDLHLLQQLPGESTHSATGENDDFIAILYGQVGTQAFAKLYKSLKKSSQINLIVRHMGFILYEEGNFASTFAYPTVMQGYGVRLDIRNVEYKAFDDGPGDKKEGDIVADWNDVGHHPEQPARDEYLGGVNLHTILERLQVDNTKPLVSDLNALQTAAIRSHSFQLGSESIIPPAWQRRSLSMQAARLIVSSPDPLLALKGVSQNLPSVAHSLSTIQIDESFEVLAENATKLATKVGAVTAGWGDAAFGFYVNAREVNIERPSFNVFQLLKILREEDLTLRKLEDNVRPALKKAALILGRKDMKGKSVEWQALQSVRKMMDMGAEKVIELGKGRDVSSSNVPNESGGLEEKQETQTSRIDVGRGGKNAVLYLNDIEKDPEYSSWPTSMQEMLYRAQFGGAPTVRRNLFTMMLVVDPASGNPNPAIDAIAQLLNAQFPLRVGVLIVNEDDVAEGHLSELPPWDDGDRPFHAKDSFLLLKHITNTYGGMVAISCLLQNLHVISQIDESYSAKEFVGAHTSLLVQMGVLQQTHVTKVQNEFLNILKTGEESVKDDSKSKNKDLSYESAVRFAKEKLIRPGMSFFNGIPLPTTAANFESKINTILQNEQSMIFDLAMKGVIKGHTPKSIYATLLSGEKCFKQYHPLLDESAGKYLLASPRSDESSLMLVSPPTSDYSNVDAFFVVEAVVDLDDPTGIEAASSFLTVISSSAPDSWHDSTVVTLAARVVVSAGDSVSSTSQAMGSLFCDASLFDMEDLKTVVNHIKATKDVEVNANLFDKVEGLSKSVRRKMAEVVTAGRQCPSTTVNDEKYLYTANGRVYVPSESPLITLEDIKMLINLELDKTVAVSKSILPNLTSNSATNDKSLAGRSIHHAIGTSVATLNDAFSSATKSEGASSALSTDLAFSQIDKEENPLYFSWNNDVATENLQVSIGRAVTCSCHIIFISLT